MHKLRHDFQEAFRWFTQQTPPDPYKPKWDTMLRGLRDRNIPVWQYLAYIIWYDPRCGSDKMANLTKNHAIQSSGTMDRFEVWRRNRAEVLEPKVAYQLDYLREKVADLKDPERLLLAPHIEASTMVRMEVLAEWRDKITTEEFKYITNRLFTQAFEMYMCFPTYKHLTPKAWALVEELANARQ